MPSSSSEPYTQGVLASLWKCMCEFIGTFILVLSVGLNVVLAATLLSLVYFLGNLFGAMFNPALSSAVVASSLDKCAIAHAAMSITFLLMGGMCGSLLYAAFHVSGPTQDTAFGLAPGAGYDLFRHA